MAPRGKRKQWPQRRIIVLLTFACTAVCYVERTGFSIAFTAVANSSGITQKSKGNLLSAFFYGYSISQIPGGWIAQRIGGRRVLLWSFLAWTAACLATPRDNHGVIIAIRVVVGIAQGFIIPSVHTVLAQWVPPHERSRSVSLTTSGMYLGAALGMLFLPELVHWAGPRSVYVVEAAMGVAWAVLWQLYAADPPLSEHPKASAAGFGAPADIELKSIHSVKPGEEMNGSSGKGGGVTTSNETWKGGGGEISAASGGMGGRTHIPWKKILQSLPVWAIVVNNYTFHYVLYVLMSWLPTYFDQGLQVGLQHMGASKTLPYAVMFVMSNVGGMVADYLVTRRKMGVGRARKWINSVGFLVAAAGLGLMPGITSVQGAILCSSVILGFSALGRAGFAVNHMDIAPRYAGIVMGISNTAGTFAGIVGVNLTGWILQSASKGPADLGSWRLVFGLPAVLCVFSAAVFCIYASGERVFE